MLQCKSKAPQSTGPMPTSKDYPDKSATCSSNECLIPAKTEGHLLLPRSISLSWILAAFYFWCPKSNFFVKIGGKPLQWLMHLLVFCRKSSKDNESFNIYGYCAITYYN